MIAMAGSGERDELAEVSRIALRAALLRLLTDHPRHGYELAGSLGTYSLVSTSASYLYRTLRALEAEGLVGSNWYSAERGQARRTYHLTSEGQIALSDLVQRISCVAEHLQAFAKKCGVIGDPDLAHPSPVTE